jgi:hypothetical protein
MASSDDDRDPRQQLLERMKNDFLVAQQRRETAAASRGRGSGDGDGPPLAGADGQKGLAGFANLTPCRL